MSGRGRTRALVSWSGGKDSAWMLHVLRERHRDAIEVAGLLTTVDEADGRAATHAVRAELLRAQARAAGLPLLPVPLPRPCPNAAYEAALGAALARARGKASPPSPSATSSWPTSGATGRSCARGSASRPSSPSGAGPPPPSRGR